MKNTFFIAFLLTLSLSIHSQTTTPVEKKIEKREIGSFNKIKAGKGINVTLVEGKKESIEIHIKNALPEDVISELAGKTLTLKMKTKIYKEVAVQVYVTYIQLVEVAASVGASIDSETYIKADRLVVSAGTDAAINIQVDVNALEASASASLINVSVTARYQEVVANTGATYNATDVQSDEVYVKSNTGANATVRAGKKLTANAGSGGKIYYYGNPAILESSATMGGKIEPAIKSDEE